MAILKPVGVIMGSISDSNTMKYCLDVLDDENIYYDEIVASAHREPNKVKSWVDSAPARGNKVIIAAAGMAAALPGVVASFTSLPVIGVPMTSELNGMDSLLSISQMPKGVPVACMSIGKAGAINAALFAKQILDLIPVKFNRVIHQGWPGDSDWPATYRSGRRFFTESGPGHGSFE